MMRTVVVALLLTAAIDMRAAEPPVAFVNVNVLTMISETRLRQQTVIVRDGKIAAIGDAATTPVPEDARKIDGEAGTLIPGLVDLHTHVTYPNELPLYLANGVTTIVTLNGGPQNVGWRKDVESGKLDGPRIITTGPPIIGVDDADQARRLVAHQAETGFDGIKIYNRISMPALEAMIDEARKRKLLSIAHIPRNLTWQDVLKARPDAIAHAEEFLYSPVLEGDEEKILAGLRDGHVALITTLVAYDTISRQVSDLHGQLDRGELKYVSPVSRRLWAPGRNRYEASMDPKDATELRGRFYFQRTLLKPLAAGGVRLLAGTDGGGVPFVFPGSSLTEELEQLVNAGLTPYQALATATRDAAAFLGRANVAGTIEVGKEADLVLLRANPLLDIGHVQMGIGVMTRGRWLDQQALRAMLDRVSAANARELEVVRLVDAGQLDSAVRAATADTISEAALNELGYQLLKVQKDAAGAVKLFARNTQLHPRSGNAWDSLGEAQAAAGDKQAALASYRRALELDPTNENAKAIIEELAR